MYCGDLVGENMKKPDYILKLGTMRKQVREELCFIPRGNDDQNTLRQLYWTYRMRSLGKKPYEYKDKNKGEILKICILMIREDELGFEPKYDKKFFKVKTWFQ